MRKIILTVFTTLLVVVSVNAQASFGIKGGVNFASILGESVDLVKGRTSFNVGAVAEIEINSASAFQVELLYSGQGFSLESGEYQDEVIKENTIKMNYLNIPLLYKYYVSEGFSLEIGPQIGFLLAASDENETSEDLNDQLTTASFDLALGLGYKLENGINFNARYTYGFTDVWKGVDDGYEDYYYYYDYGQRNGVFQLTVGYNFN